MAALMEHGPQAPSPDQSPGGEAGQRRLTAIMFTDMVGYSALTRKSESLALELVEQQNGLLRQRFVEHGGREIKAMGDGFLVVFDSAWDAVRCAVAVQTAVHARNASVQTGKTFHVRIGVHVGDVVHQGEDVFGDGVNLAARVQCLARPGGICVTEQVVNLIRHAAGLPLVKLGKAALKNIPTPVRVYCVALPWEKRPVSLCDRVSYACFHHKRALSFADLMNAAFIAAIASLMLWQSVAEHKAIHAKVWFGEGSPADTRPLGVSAFSPLALTDVGLDRSRPSVVERTTPDAPPALEPRNSPVEQRTGPAQPTPMPALLAHMVKRDSGATFHFARHYDRIRAQLQKSYGSAPSVPPGPVPNMPAPDEQTLFAELFRWTLQSGAKAGPAGAL